MLAAVEQTMRSDRTHAHSTEADVVAGGQKCVHNHENEPRRDTEVRDRAKTKCTSFKTESRKETYM